MELELAMLGPLQPSSGLRPLRLHRETNLAAPASVTLKVASLSCVCVCVCLFEPHPSSQLPSHQGSPPPATSSAGESRSPLHSGLTTHLCRRRGGAG